MNLRFLLLTIIFFIFSSNASADNAGVNLDLSPVVVTGTRTEQNSFDLPMSINAINSDTLHDATQQVNISESAARIPGVVLNNRNHGAQELAITSRGFGARSQFGVRGMRLYTDGMPLTMPDGLGVPSGMNLDNASRVEFLRGPFSSLYGNSSGGVVQLFTKNGGQDTELFAGAFYGSYGSHRETSTISGNLGNVNYFFNASHYKTDGYRAWSGFEKDFNNAKFLINLSESTKLTFIGMEINQPYVRDPGGVTKTEFNNSPRVANTANSLNYAHKEMDHTQFGFIVDHTISNTDQLKLVTYAGDRANYQSFSVKTISGYNRDFGGMDARWIHEGLFVEKPFNLTLGMNYDRAKDNRYRYGAVAINGQLPSGQTKTRDEINYAFNFDQYAQMQVDVANDWILHAGLRHSRVVFENTDKKAHAYDSIRNFEKTTPVAGIIYKVNPSFNLYANAGRGFETPTFIETEYADTLASAPNTTIQASTSKNYEVGAKAFLTNDILMNLAIFKTITSKEIIMSSYAADAAVYRNAPGETERKGIELSLDANLPNNFKTYLSYSYLDAQFKEGFTSVYGAGSQPVLAGYKIPGTYKNRAYAELSWRYPSLGFYTAIEGIYSSNSFVDDKNSESADAYTVFNWKGSFQQTFSKFNVSEFVRVDNITDKNYVSSVRVNDSGSRFYEPGSASNWTLGINGSYKF
jgi:iron complex outermembrane receptor protein